MCLCTAGIMPIQNMYHIRRQIVREPSSPVTSIFTYRCSVLHISTDVLTAERDKIQHSTHGFHCIQCLQQDLTCRTKVCRNAQNPTQLAQQTPSYKKCTCTHTHAHVRTTQLLKMSASQFLLYIRRLGTTTTTISNFSSCLTGHFSWDYSKLCYVPYSSSKGEPLGITSARLFTGWMLFLSPNQTNHVKALKYKLHATISQLQLTK